ncbi:MAG: hypothetical protein DWQ31_12020 [Planctomycetota bacterium]|nr:MAG: hypothetical protein DWQ31_12020 [Planctomycetota bacterium]REJ87344.1 MAG: hypothetical protein DWQ35_21575 [Planctomycetota bacterium]
MSSPVVYDGHVYLHLRNQWFICIDLASGETKWTTQPFGRYWNMVAAGEKILALDERGELLLIRPIPRNSSCSIAARSAKNRPGLTSRSAERTSISVNSKV